MLKETIIFSLGAAASAVASYFYWKNHYEKWAQDEINTMRDFYKKRNGVTETEEERVCDEPILDAPEAKPKERTDDTVPEMMHYAKMLQTKGYTDYSEAKRNTSRGNVYPYDISADEFGEKEDYDCISLDYYSDGVLTDSTGDVIDDIDRTVGRDFARYFDKYQEDAIYIRNDRLQCDYEILRNITPYIE